MTANGAADGACGAFGHGFDEVVAATATHAHAGDAFIPCWALRGGSRTAGIRSVGQRLAGASFEDFEGGFAINGIFVNAGNDGSLHQLAALFGSDGADLAVRRANERAIDDAGRAVFVEEGDQSFAYGEFGDGFLHIDFGIGAEGVGGGAHGFLIGGREGAKSVLHAIAELAENGVRDIEGILRDEINANTLGTNQADNLDDFLFDRLGKIGEEQVGFIKEENELGLFGIADFGEAFEKAGEQP